MAGLTPISGLELRNPRRVHLVFGQQRSIRAFQRKLYTDRAYTVNQNFRSVINYFDAAKRYFVENLGLLSPFAAGSKSRDPQIVSASFDGLRCAAHGTRHVPVRLFAQQPILRSSPGARVDISLTYRRNAHPKPFAGDSFNTAPEPGGHFFIRP